jgi:hypothetical protein
LVLKDAKLRRHKSGLFSSLPSFPSAFYVRRPGDGDCRGGKQDEN